MKIERPKPWKSQKASKKCDFIGTCFLVIFWIAKKHAFGAQNGQNHSGGKARGRQKIDKNATLFPCWCFLVPRGCLRTRCLAIFGRISDGFGMFFRTFSWHFLCQKTCDRSCPPSAEKLFGAHVWHALGTKSAMTRTTRPQHSFSKGDGSAKRPQ